MPKVSSVTMRVASTSGIGNDGCTPASAASSTISSLIQSSK
jgi:hypothetical protein